MIVRYAFPLIAISMGVSRCRPLSSARSTDSIRSSSGSDSSSGVACARTAGGSASA
jgi:hypothetical protein